MNTYFIRAAEAIVKSGLVHYSRTVLWNFVVRAPGNPLAFSLTALVRSRVFFYSMKILRVNVCIVSSALPKAEAADERHTIVNEPCFWR
jgi:hypothetical protein